MKKSLFCILAAALTAMSALAAPKATTLLSPNGKLTVNLETSSGSVSYTVIKEGKPMYEIRDIRLTTGTETIPAGSIKVGKTRFVYDQFHPVGLHVASRHGQCGRLSVRDGPERGRGSV